MLSWLTKRLGGAQSTFPTEEVSVVYTPSKLPHIVSAAVLYPKLLRGEDVVIMSVRHGDDIANHLLDILDRVQNDVCTRADTHPDESMRPIQGFVGSDGIFYTRQEAYAIVKASGQKLTEHAREEYGMLFSENLYK